MMMRKILVFAAVLAAAANLFSCKGRQHDIQDEAVQVDEFQIAAPGTY